MTQVAAHGQLGYAAVASPDLRSLIGVIQRFSPLRLSGLYLQGAETAERYELLALERFEMLRIREFVYGNLASISVRLLETASGTLDLGALQFAFPFARPAWADQYHRMLGPNVDFDAPVFRFSMPLEWLDWPCLTADAELARLALRDCEYQLQHQNQGQGWSGRIRRCCGHGKPRWEACILRGGSRFSRTGGGFRRSRVIGTRERMLPSARRWTNRAC